MKRFTLSASLALALSIVTLSGAAPVLAHGAAEPHTHPSDMMGLAALLALAAVAVYLLWKKRA